MNGELPADWQSGGLLRAPEPEAHLLKNPDRQTNI